MATKGNLTILDVLLDFYPIETIDREVINNWEELQEASENCGDTLFDFLAHELSECQTPGDALRRLLRASNDVNSVINGIVDTWDKLD